VKSSRAVRKAVAGRNVLAGSGLETVMTEAASNSSVQFDHEFFKSFSGIHFRLSDDGEPVAVLALSPTSEAVVSLGSIAKQFGIAESSPDGRMLNQVAESLHFVVGLQMGQPLPTELTTGQSTWTPSERHVTLARHRLTLQLVTWVTGEEHIFTSSEELLMLVEDPKTKKTITVAFGDAAVQLGLERSNHDAVIAQIEVVARELAHIEALRDLFAKVRQVDAKVQELRNLFSADQALGDTTLQVAKLSKRCVDHFTSLFQQVDAQTGEIVSMLKNIANQIEYIRKARDDLYRRLHPWEAVCGRWKGVYTSKSPETVAAVHDLYRFLAPRYMVVREWTLMSQRKGKDAKPIGGQLRW
jgi:uncharacterized protein YukE